MDVMRGFLSPSVQPVSLNPTGNQPVPGIDNTQVTQPDPNNPTNPGNQNKGSDGSVGAFPVVDADKSPLDGYKELWQPIKDAKAPASLVPTFTMDMTKIQAAASNLDFTKNLDPAVMANALKGDSTALATLLNGTAQSGFAHAIAATGTIVKEALQQQSDTFFKTVVPDMFRKEQITTGVRGANPAFSDPAMAPIVRATEQQMSAKYPQASPDEITKHTQEFLSGMAMAIAKGNKQQITDMPSLDNTSIFGGMGSNTDWDSWITR